MKNILIGLLIVGGLIGLTLWAKQYQAKLPEKETISIGSDLVSDKTLHDFGEISMSNGKVSTLFQVSNNTQSDIILESVTTSCMCTNAYLVNGLEKKGPYGMPGHGGPVMKANKTIRAGETQDVEVVYDPNAHGPAGVGPVDRFVFLQDSNGKTLQLEIKAVVKP